MFPKQKARAKSWVGRTPRNNGVLQIVTNKKLANDTGVHFKLQAGWKWQGKLLASRN